MIYLSHITTFVLPRYALMVSLPLALLLFSCQRQTGKRAAIPAKPNIIIVMADDQGYGDLGHTGNPIIQTPTIDQFSREAINLSNYHVGTTCAPTRAGLMTGRNCNRNGVWHTVNGASILNREETTLADVFKEAGYHTAMFGKWHLGDNSPFLPHERGFDEAFYHGGGGIGQTPDYWNNDYFDDTYFRNGTPEAQTGYCTDLWFNEAIDFIKRSQATPFLCYLSLNAAHSPFNVPMAYYDLYKDAVQLTASQKRFYAMITNIDDNFARLLQTLDSLQLANHTIVIYTTDNGTAMGFQVNEHTRQTFGYNAGMRGVKGSEYEGGHRVPFIIRWPDGGLQGGQQLSGLAAHVDVLPTLASLAGIPYTPTHEMDGLDISTYLQGKAEPSPRYLVTDTQRILWPEKGKQSCVMDGPWRLIRGTELYNLTEDPGQNVNLAQQYPERVIQMNDFYDTWWESVIQETHFSRIDLGVDTITTLTCHDSHAQQGPTLWDQELIRQGERMAPAPYAVNFVKGGRYKIHLARWPQESGLALGEGAHDSLPAHPNMNARIKGTALTFTQAHLQLGQQPYSIAVDPHKPFATMAVTTTAGPTTLTGYFDLADGTPMNALYVYVEKIE